MSLPFSEHFYGQDWAHYASQSSKLTAITCLVLGIIEIFLRFDLFAGLIPLTVGGILSLWEFPFFFFWLRNYEQIKEFLEVKLNLKFEEAKGIMCLIFSLLCFHFSGWLTLSAFLLLVTAVLFIFAAINRRSDQNLMAEAQAPSSHSFFPNALPLYQPIPNETTSLPRSASNKPVPNNQYNSSAPKPTTDSNSFGTFQNQP